MTQIADTDLLTLIEERQTIAAQAAEEYDGIVGNVRTRRVYDWYTRTWVVRTFNDCSGRREVAATPEIGPIEQPRKRRPRGRSRDIVLAWLRENGPATRGQVVTGTGLTVNQVEYTLYQSGCVERVQMPGVPANVSSWQVIESGE
jgi:hypothetical protein